MQIPKWSILHSKEVLSLRLHRRLDKTTHLVFIDRSICRFLTGNCSSFKSVGSCLTPKTNASVFVNADANSACKEPCGIGAGGFGVSIFAPISWSGSCTTYLAAISLMRCHRIGSIGTRLHSETLLLKISFTYSLTPTR